MRVGERGLTPLEMQYVEFGLKKTNSTVPKVDVPLTNQWLLMNQLDLPVGLLSEMEHRSEDGSSVLVEIGARVWDMSPATTLALADWIEDVLCRYDVAVARVYRSNDRVKRLLQRGGFRLVTPGKVETYAVTSKAYLGRRRNMEGVVGHG